MAKLSNPDPGGFTGRIGALVYSKWKGIPVIKTRPGIGSRAKRRAPGEALNQSKFATAHNWLRPIISYLRAGFKGYTPTVEGFNAAKSYTLKNAFTGNQVLDPALVKVSHGELMLSPNITLSIMDDLQLQFSWDADPGTYHNTHRDDQAMLLAYDADNKNVKMRLTGFFRHGGRAELMLDAGHTYHVYLAFAAHDRSRQSNSVYLGKVNT